MEPTGFALPGGLPVPARDGVALLEEAAERGCAPLFVTEVAVNDATAVLAAVAARRPGGQLGTAVIPLGSRSLAAVAMGAATVAGLTEAEFLLGVGVSTPPIVDGWHGSAWTASVAATRARLLELRRLLDGDRRGSFRLGVPPGERVRVLLGALGPRMVELGLEAAGGVVCSGRDDCGRPRTACLRSSSTASSCGPTRSLGTSSACAPPAQCPWCSRSCRRAPILWRRCGPSPAS